MGSQKTASYKIDFDTHKRLSEGAPTARERKRLIRVCEPHAGAFVTALPCTDDGNDTVMKPQLFRTAVAYRLGVPVVPDEFYCPLCKQIVDCVGDHASCCAKNGGLIKRHNRVRNLVMKFCREAHLSPILEKTGIIQKRPLRRPGDVTLPIWANDKGLAIDVAVTSPFCTAGMRATHPADSYAENQKHRRYDEGFKKSGYYFCAMVLESTGALGGEATSTLRQVFRFASRKQNAVHSVYAGRAWARLSCALQSSVAQNILVRTSAWDPRAGPEAGSVEEREVEGGRNEEEEEGIERKEERKEGDGVREESTVGRAVPSFVLVSPLVAHTHTHSERVRERAGESEWDIPERKTERARESVCGRETKLETFLVGGGDILEVGGSSDKPQPSNADRHPPNSKQPLVVWGSRALVDGDSRALTPMSAALRKHGRLASDAAPVEPRPPTKMSSNFIDRPPSPSPAFPPLESWVQKEIDRQSRLETLPVYQGQICCQGERDFSFFPNTQDSKGVRLEQEAKSALFSSLRGPSEPALFSCEPALSLSMSLVKQQSKNHKHQATNLKTTNNLTTNDNCRSEH